MKQWRAFAGASVVILGTAGMLAQHGEARSAPSRTSPVPAFEPEMVPIPGGAFVMGSKACSHPAYREVRLKKCPLHEVRIKPFKISKFEVTWDQWAACVEDGGCPGKEVEAAGGDQGWGRGRRPVINVSWYDAKAYVNWLSRRTDKAYRLVSEAEWEYVVRAGGMIDMDPNSMTVCRYENIADKSHEDPNWISEVPYFGCDDGFVNTAPVGSFDGNAFGVHDMMGNVSEWVADCYHSSYKGAPGDGSAWTRKCKTDNGFKKIELGVVRGGHFGMGTGYLGSADTDDHVSNRSEVVKKYRFEWAGFRVALPEDS